jgi:hypothetical protein
MCGFCVCVCVCLSVGVCVQYGSAVCVCCLCVRGLTMLGMLSTVLPESFDPPLLLVR